MAKKTKVMCADCFHSAPIQHSPFGNTDEYCQCELWFHGHLTGRRIGMRPEDVHKKFEPIECDFFKPDAGKIVSNKCF